MEKWPIRQTTQITIAHRHRLLPTARLVRKQAQTRPRHKARVAALARMVAVGEAVRVPTVEAAVVVLATEAVEEAVLATAEAGAGAGAVDLVTAEAEEADPAPVDVLAPARDISRAVRSARSAWTK
jgi:hypothetical protein